MKKSEQIFDKVGGVPVSIEKGDDRLLICGMPPRVSCRVLAEETYQALVTAADKPDGPEDFVAQMQGLINDVQTTLTRVALSGVTSERLNDMRNKLDWAKEKIASYERKAKNDH